MPSTFHFLEGQPVQSWRVAWFVRLWAVSGLSLFAVTWPLWTPSAEFPQVPLVAWGGAVPAWLQWLALTVVVVSLLALLAAPRSRLLAIAMGAFTAAMVILFLSNQHRLQPWAYQFAIIAVLLAALPPRRGFVLLRWLVVSIYLFSAVSKFDYSFLHSLGRDFLGATAGLAAIDALAWSPESQVAGAWLFPLGELVIAVGLCLPLKRSLWLRRAVLGLLVTTHLLLIIILSPIGLSHQPGVLLWNAWFIAQGILLFGFPPPEGETLPASKEDQAWWRELTEVMIEFLVAAVILLPVLEWFGRFDHWPAWGLYAPRNSRATLFVHESMVKRLPADVAKYASGPSEHSGDWRQLQLNRWSLEKLGAPIYPQDRFQLGVAAEVVRRYGLHDGFHIILEGPADRLTGRRPRETLWNIEAVIAAQRRFLLNSRARQR